MPLYNNTMNVNTKKLNSELHYHPPWPEDKPIFMRLLTQSHFTDDDILLFARLYVKYSHIHCFTISELTNYFKYMLIKMQIYSSDKLFDRTKFIYTRLNN